MNASSMENRYMEFCLAEQFYCIPLLMVKEVIQRPEITPVPNMPSFFEGMMNLRGQILGVFNTKKRMLTKQDNTEKNNEVIIVIESEGMAIGMIVDQVNRVIHASPESIKPAPLKENDSAKVFISGVISNEEKLILILSVDKLLELNKYKNDLRDKIAA